MRTIYKQTENLITSLSLALFVAGCGGKPESPIPTADYRLELKSALGSASNRIQSFALAGTNAGSELYAIENSRLDLTELFSSTGTRPERFVAPHVAAIHSNASTVAFAVVQGSYDDLLCRLAVMDKASGVLSCADQVSDFRYVPSRGGPSLQGDGADGLYALVYDPLSAGGVRARRWSLRTGYVTNLSADSEFVLGFNVSRSGDVFLQGHDASSQTSTFARIRTSEGRSVSLPSELYAVTSKADGEGFLFWSRGSRVVWSADRANGELSAGIHAELPAVLPDPAVVRTCAFGSRVFALSSGRPVQGNDLFELVQGEVFSAQGQMSSLRDLACVGDSVVLVGSYGVHEGAAKVYSPESGLWGDLFAGGSYRIETLRGSAAGRVLFSGTQVSDGSPVLGELVYDSETRALRVESMSIGLSSRAILGLVTF